jgi:hypothetical protein
MSVDEQIDIIQNQIINFVISFFNYKRILIYILLIGLNRLFTIAFGL